MGKKITNPLSPEDYLRVKEIYQTLRRERSELFGGLPFGINWLKLRYLKRGTIRTLATAKLAREPVLSIHRMAFEYTKPILLKGLIHHELLHFVLGASVGHNKDFRWIEKSWEEYPDYFEHRRRFVRIIEESERDAGNLFRYQCPNCHSVLLRTREMKPESACSKCCETFNDGVWTKAFAFIRVGYSDQHHESDWK